MSYRGYGRSAQGPSSATSSQSNRFQAASSSSSSERLVVYTDGSCINNGKADARGGVGVYIPETS